MDGAGLAVVCDREADYNTHNIQDKIESSLPFFFVTFFLFLLVMVLFVCLFFREERKNTEGRDWSEVVVGLGAGLT